MLREGSAWRRWDLHVHAPTSVLNNQFAGVDDLEKWARYLNAIEGLGSYGALGITDYLSVDGYKRAREYQLTGRLQNVGLLLPNIELRIIPVTEKAKAINLHLIVCPSIADELEELLFANLEFAY